MNMIYIHLTINLIVEGAEEDIRFFDFKCIIIRLFKKDEEHRLEIISIRQCNVDKWTAIEQYYSSRNYDWLKCSERSTFHRSWKRGKMSIFFVFEKLIFLWFSSVRINLFFEFCSRNVWLFVFFFCVHIFSES